MSPITTITIVCMVVGDSNFGSATASVDDVGFLTSLALEDEAD